MEIISGFPIKIFDTIAVVPSKVPRIVCGRTNFHIAAPSAFSFPVSPSTVVDRAMTRRRRIVAVAVVVAAASTPRASIAHSNPRAVDDARTVTVARRVAPTSTRRRVAVRRALDLAASRVVVVVVAVVVARIVARIVARGAVCDARRGRHVTRPTAALSTPQHMRDS
jgi:hypothetical protein